jgi:hypothetical protein
MRGALVAIHGRSNALRGKLLKVGNAIPNRRKNNIIIRQDFSLKAPLLLTTVDVSKQETTM